MASMNAARSPAMARLGTLQLLGGRDALIFQGGDAAGKNRLGNERDGNAQFAGTDHGPFAGALLAGGVEDFVHQRLAVGVFESQNVGRRSRSGRNPAPFLFHSAKTGCISAAVMPRPSFINVGLANQLHVAVLDAVMDHFDIMAGAVFAHPVAAGTFAVFTLAAMA